MLSVLTNRRGVPGAVQLFDVCKVADPCLRNGGRLAYAHRRLKDGRQVVLTVLTDRHAAVGTTLIGNRDIAAADLIALGRQSDTALLGIDNVGRAVLTLGDAAGIALLNHIGEIISTRLVLNRLACGIGVVGDQQ